MLALVFWGSYYVVVYFIVDACLLVVFDLVFQY